MLQPRPLSLVRTILSGPQRLPAPLRRCLSALATSEEVPPPESTEGEEAGKAEAVSEALTPPHCIFPPSQVMRFLFAIPHLHEHLLD